MRLIRFRNVRALVLMIVLVLVAVPLGAAATPVLQWIPTPLVHPGVVILDDDGFGVIGISGVKSGSGSAEDPYVISGWRFVISSSVPSVHIENTTKHVVIRDNAFLGEGVSLTRAPAVRIVGAQNVVIADNVFLDVPLVLQVGPLRDQPSATVVFTDNFVRNVGHEAVRFEADEGRIEGNRFFVRPTLFADIVRVSNAAGPVAIVGNEFTHDGPSVRAIQVHATRLDAPIEVERNRIVNGDIHMQGAGAMRVVENEVTGSWAGIRVSSASGNATVERNVIEGAHLCLGVSGPMSTQPPSGIPPQRVLVAENRLDGCGIALSTSAWHSRVDPSNRIDGRSTLQVVDAENVLIDGAVLPVGWLEVVFSRNVTIRDVHLESSAGDVRLLEIDGLRVESSSFKSTLRIAASDIDIEDVTVHAEQAVTLALWGGDATLLDFTARRIGAVPFPTSGVSMIVFSPNSTVRVEGSRFENYSTAGLVVGGPATDTELVVDDSVFRGNGDGLRMHRGTATVRGSSFFDNSGNAAYVDAARATLDARHNWWGHATGPRTDDNPEGRGDAVSAGVLFDPWLVEKP